MHKLAGLRETELDWYEDRGIVERSVNVKLLRKHFAESERLEKERMAIDADYSVAAIEKMMSRKKAPKALARLAMAKRVRVHVDILFPIRSQK